MDVYFKVSVTSLIIMVMMMFIVGMVTLFPIREENRKAEEMISGQDAYLTGYQVLLKLVEGKGVPDNWHKSKDIIVIGLLDDQYDIDLEKVDFLFNMSSERFREFVDIGELNYSFTLLNDGEVVKSQDRNQSDSIVVRKEVDKYYDLVMYIW